MCVSPLAALSPAAAIIKDGPKKALPFISPALAIMSKGKSKQPGVTQQPATAGGY